MLSGKFSYSAEASGANQVLYCEATRHPFRLDWRGVLTGGKCVIFTRRSFLNNPVLQSSLL